MLFKEIIPVYTENKKKHKYKMQLLIFEAAGTYSYHSALKG
jgi:hypothetical protein